MRKIQDLFQNEIPLDDTIELPIGDNQLELNLQKPKDLCDCGGYKVYGTDYPALHSVWCSSLKNKEVKE